MNGSLFDQVRPEPKYHYTAHDWALSASRIASELKLAAEFDAPVVTLHDQRHDQLQVSCQ